MSAQERAIIVTAQQQLTTAVANARRSAYRTAISGIDPNHDRYENIAMGRGRAAADAAERRLEQAHYDKYGIHIDVETNFAAEQLAWAAEYNGRTGDLTLTRTNQPATVQLDESEPAVAASITSTVVRRQDRTWQQQERVVAKRPPGEHFVETTTVERAASGNAISARQDVDRRDRLASDTYRDVDSSTTHNRDGHVTAERYDEVTTRAATGPEGPTVVHEVHADLTHTYEKGTSGRVVSSTTMGTQSERGVRFGAPSGTPPVDRTQEIHHLTNRYDASGEVTSSDWLIHTTSGGARITDDSEARFRNGQMVRLDSTLTTAQTFRDEASGQEERFSQTVSRTIANDDAPIFTRPLTDAQVREMLLGDPALLGQFVDRDADYDERINTTRVQQPVDTTGDYERFVWNYSGSRTNPRADYSWGDVTLDYTRFTDGAQPIGHRDTFKPIGVDPTSGLPIPFRDQGDVQWLAVPEQYRHVIGRDGSYIGAPDDAAARALYDQHAWPAYGAKYDDLTYDGWLWDTFDSRYKDVMQRGGWYVREDGQAVVFPPPDDTSARAQRWREANQAWTDHTGANTVDEYEAWRARQTPEGPSRSGEFDNREWYTKAWDAWNDAGRYVVRAGLGIAGGIALVSGAGAPVGLVLMAVAGVSTAAEAAGVITGQRGANWGEVALSATGLVPVSAAFSAARSVAGAVRQSRALQGAVSTTGRAGNMLATGGRAADGVLRNPYARNVVDEAGASAIAAAASGGGLGPLDLLFGFGGVWLGGRATRRIQPSSAPSNAAGGGPALSGGAYSSPDAPHGRNPAAATADQAAELAARRARIPADPAVALRGTILEDGTWYRGGKLPQSADPNSILFKWEEGMRRVNSYAVYGADGTIVKRVDLTGATHNGVPTPHVVEFSQRVVPQTGRRIVEPRPHRAATAEEALADASILGVTSAGASAPRPMAVRLAHTPLDARIVGRRITMPSEGGNRTDAFDVVAANADTTVVRYAGSHKERTFRTADVIGHNARLLENHDLSVRLEAGGPVVRGRVSAGDVGSVTIVTGDTAHVLSTKHLLELNPTLTDQLEYRIDRLGLARLNNDRFRIHDESTGRFIGSESSLAEVSPLARRFGSLLSRLHLLPTQTRQELEARIALQDARRAANFANDVFRADTLDGTPLDIYIGSSLRGNAYFLERDRSIHVSSERVYDEFVMAHEYGHLVHMRNASAMPPSGYSNFDGTAEGFADAFAQLLTHRTFNGDRNPAYARRANIDDAIARNRELLEGHETATLAGGTFWSIQRSFGDRAARVLLAETLSGLSARGVAGAGFDDLEAAIRAAVVSPRFREVGVDSAAIDALLDDAFRRGRRTTGPIAPNGGAVLDPHHLGSGGTALSPHGIGDAPVVLDPTVKEARLAGTWSENTGRTLLTGTRADLVPTFDELLSRQHSISIIGAHHETPGVWYLDLISGDAIFVSGVRADSRRLDDTEFTNLLNHGTIVEMATATNN